jgi:hypothetical protein
MAQLRDKSCDRGGPGRLCVGLAEVNRRLGFHHLEEVAL